MTDKPATEKTTTTPIPWAVVHDYEGLVDRISALVFEEDSAAWRHIGEVLERLVPGISPFDRREATSQVLQPVRQVIVDELY